MTDPLTEAERELVEFARANGAWAMPGLDPDGCTDALVVIIDRLSAAPVDDRERVPEGWRVEWETEPPHGPGEGPRQLPYLAEIPAVSPSVDPGDTP